MSLGCPELTQVLQEGSPKAEILKEIIPKDRRIQEQGLRWGFIRTLLQTEIPKPDFSKSGSPEFPGPETETPKPGIPIIGRFRAPYLEQPH